MNVNERFIRSPFWLGDGSKVVCADSVDHSFEEADSPHLPLDACRQSAADRRDVAGH
jgi:hypothetical protein